jgi:hypothetical protein
MKLYSFTIQLFFYKKRDAFESLDSIGEILGRSLGEHRGKWTEHLDSLLHLIHMMRRVPQLIGYTFKVGGGIENSKSIGMKYAENGGFLDSNI